MKQKWGVTRHYDYTVTTPRHTCHQNWKSKPPCYWKIKHGEGSLSYIHAGKCIAVLQKEDGIWKSGVRYQPTAFVIRDGKILHFLVTLLFIVWWECFSTLSICSSLLERIIYLLWSFKIYCHTLFLFFPQRQNTKIKLYYILCNHFKDLKELQVIETTAFPRVGYAFRTAKTQVKYIFCTVAEF